MKIDERVVHIYWKNTVSSYAKLNAKYISPAPKLIGGSLSAIDAMLANGEEQKALMPTILGVSANSNDWNIKLTNYWNNISIEILSEGKSLNIGFIYDIESMNKKEYINSINVNINKESDKLKTDEDLYNFIEDKLALVYKDFERQYAAAIKVVDEKLKSNTINALYKHKYLKIIELESQRYKLGTPINTYEYMVYRYALVYRDVANDVKLSSKSPNIRFYLHSQKDIELHKSEQKKLQRNRISAFVKATKDVKSMETVLYALGFGVELADMDDSDKYVYLEDYSKKAANTVKFIAIVNDKNLEQSAVIEKYIVANILYRVPGSQIVTDFIDKSNIIGNTTNEVLAYFKSDDNKTVVSEYINRFKALPK